MRNPEVLTLIERQLAKRPRLLNAWVGRAEQLERQRTLFLREYAPSRLDALPLDELLQAIPFNLSQEAPLDLWLETRQDAAFDTQRFGALQGSSLLKFGVWQDRESGSWRIKSPRNPKASIEADAEGALEIVEQRRAEMIAAAQTLTRFALHDVDHLDPAEVQGQVQDAAPTWHASAWLHKYLHLCCPQLVGPHHALALTHAACYRVGLTPQAGMYANDIQIAQFWEAVCVLVPLPVMARHHVLGEVKPRRHWILRAPSAAAANRLLRRRCIGLGPRPDVDLQALLTRASGGVQERLRALFFVQGLEPARDEIKSLVRLVATVEEGHVVGLWSGAGLLAVGKVDGPYAYHPEDEALTHQRSVRWLEAAKAPLLDADLTALDGEHLLSVPSTHKLAAWMEALWLLHNDADLLEPEPAPPRAQSALDTAPLEGLERRVVEMVARRGQVILYGPPGTGKTYWAERAALGLIARHNFGCLPAELTAAQWDRVLGRDGREGYYGMCVFHPTYGYEDFVEGWRADGAGGLRVESGIFKRKAHAAGADPKGMYVLVIDEINRGNIPKIFGELITLLEMTRRGDTWAHLALSGELLTVPQNILLIGTMNTADRSILLMDTALRRRFAFCELMTDYGALGEARVGPLGLGAWLRALNQRLLQYLGRDARNLQVGHAYLMVGGRALNSIEQLAAVLQDELWPLLQEYCYEDAAALGGILHGLLDTDGNLRKDLFLEGQHKALIDALVAMVDEA